MNEKRIFIVGARSTYIVEAIEICEAAGYREIFCVDNQELMKEKSIEGYPVIYLSEWNQQEGDGYVCCLHTPMFRETIVTDLTVKGFQPTSVIHPTAIISKRAKISGSGVLIAPGVIIGSNTVIGDHVTINRSC